MKTENHFSSEKRDLNYVGFAMSRMSQERLVRKSFLLHPWESGPEVDQRPGGVTTSPILLGPVLVWSQQNYLRLLKTRDISSPRRAATPATLPREKAGIKMNEAKAKFKSSQCAT